MALSTDAEHLTVAGDELPVDVLVTATESGAEVRHRIHPQDRGSILVLGESCRSGQPFGPAERGGSDRAGTDGGASRVAHEDEVIAGLARDRGRALVGYAYLLTGSMRDAEDLVQDALVKTVLRARDGIDPGTAEAYVRRAILTTFIDGHRRLRRWESLVPRLGHESTVPPPDPADRVTAQMDVRAALATLPRRERACVVLRYFDDLPLADIAETLGVTVGAVKRYLFAGRRRIEALLGPIHGTDVPDVERSML